LNGAFSGVLAGGVRFDSLSGITEGGFVDGQGIHLIARHSSGDRFSCMICGYVRNQVSINLSPFRTIKLYYFDNFKGDRWGNGSNPGYVNFYRTDPAKGLGILIKKLPMSWSNECSIDVSDINEHVFFNIGGTIGPDATGSTGGTRHFTRIEFLV
jgi:hypothetical protein